MGDKIKDLLNEGLEKETQHKGYNGRVYTLYELRASANNYSSKVSTKFRKLLKEKYSRIYNYPGESIPIELLQQVYGLDDRIKEIWKSVPGYRDGKFYEASNFGRIRHFGKLMKQDEKEEFSGYLFMNEYIDDDSNKNKYKFNATTPVYHFIAAAFFQDYKELYGKKLDIHHINNNGYDCRPDNLILLRPREHSKVHGFFVSTDTKRNIEE